jgi:hypothetical protein
LQLNAALTLCCACAQNIARENALAFLNARRTFGYSAANFPLFSVAQSRVELNAICEEFSYFANAHFLCSHHKNREYIFQSFSEYSWLGVRNAGAQWRLVESIV